MHTFSYSHSHMATSTDLGIRSDAMFLVYKHAHGRHNFNYSNVPTFELKKSIIIHVTGNVA